MLSRRTILAAVATSLVAPATRAQAFPSRVITIVVPYAPGGASDVIARLVGQQLSERLGQPVIIENKPGATTAIGTHFVARAAPDGHTLLLTAPPFVIGRYATPKPQYDSLTDFAPICQATASPLVFTASAKTPASTLKEFIEHARANPGKLNYGSTGPMGLPHLAGELICRKAGITMQHVPYRGGGPVVSDLLGGQVDLYLANPIEVAPQFSAGLKPLAVTSAMRSPLLPDVPTLAEAGLAEIDLSTWTGFFAPTATPAPIIDKLNSEISAILAMPDIRRKLNEQFSSPIGGTIAAFRAFLDREHATYAELVPGIPS